MTRASLDTLLTQAEALTRLARTAWITTTLGALYAWLALAGLRDIQLFRDDETLTLPFVNVGISPEGFFVFAPALLLAAYLHLHLTLSRLWTLYGEILNHPDAADGRFQGLPVAERVPPWLLTALIPDPGRHFALLSKAVAWIMAYAFAPLTILALGWRYLRAHEEILTGYHAVLTAAALVAAFEFHRHARAELRVRRAARSLPWTGVALATVAMALFFPAQKLIDSGWAPTGLIAPLTPNAQLRGAELSRKGPDWNDAEHAIEDARLAALRACREENADCPESDRGPAAEAEIAALERRVEAREHRVARASLGVELASRQVDANRVFWEPCHPNNDRIAEPRDLRNADLREAFLPFAKLRCADLDDIDLREASMKGADLREASMEGADLRRAMIDGANLTWSSMAGANLFGTFLEGAVLRGASMKEANLIFVSMARADLRRASMEGAVLVEASMEGADLRGASMEGADLRGASMEGAILWYISANSTEFSRATFIGAALKSVAFTESLNLDPLALAEAFGDGSVVMPDGASPPAHWPRETLTEDAFLSRWRGWREAEGMPWPPPGRALAHLADVDPIPPDRPVAPDEILR